MHRAIGLLFATFAFAAEPNEKAHKLLDEAAATVSSTNIDIHVLSLMHLGRMYQVYDKRKSVDFFRQAFAGTTAVAEDSKDALQGEIVKNLADVSLPDAIEQLRGMAAPATTLEGNTSAIDRVVSLLLAKSDFDKASEVIGLVPGEAEYPFRAAGTLFEKLPENDPRRVLVFTRATTAYQSHPAREFTEMLSAHWRKLPREVADSALTAVMNTILVKKDDSFNFEGNDSDDNGKMILKSRREVELGWMYNVLKGIDPKRAQELIATNQELKAAAAKPLQEKKAAEEAKDQNAAPEEDDGLYPPVSLLRGMDIDNMADRIGKWAAAAKKAEDAVKLADKDLQQALSRIGDLPYPVMKAVAICGLGRTFGRKDQGTGKSLYEKCTTAISDIKDPADASAPLMIAAEVANIIKQKDQAMESMQRAFVAGVEAYVAEANAEKKNKALREYWPSVQICRVVAYNAARVFGEESEVLLQSIRDPDISVVMRIELARALMKDPNVVHNMSFRF